MVRMSLPELPEKPHEKGRSSKVMGSWKAFLVRGLSELMTSQIVAGKMRVLSPLGEIGRPGGGFFCIG